MDGKDDALDSGRKYLESAGIVAPNETLGAADTVVARAIGGLDKPDKPRAVVNLVVAREVVASIDDHTMKMAALAKRLNALTKALVGATVGLVIATLLLVVAETCSKSHEQSRPAVSPEGRPTPP